MYIVTFVHLKIKDRLYEDRDQVAGNPMEKPEVRMLYRCFQKTNWNISIFFDNVRNISEIKFT